MCLWGWGGGSSGDTVHVNNQPMIVLLVSFRKGDCIRGWVGLGERGKAFLHTVPVSLVLSLGYPDAALF